MIQQDHPNIFDKIPREESVQVFHADDDYNVFLTGRDLPLTGISTPFMDSLPELKRHCKAWDPYYEHGLSADQYQASIKSLSRHIAQSTAHQVLVYDSTVVPAGMHEN